MNTKAKLFTMLALNKVSLSVRNVGGEKKILTLLGAYAKWA